MTVHKMSVWADEGQGLHLSCIEPECKTDLEIGHAVMVGRIIEAFADHQKTVSSTEQGVPA